jgi:hypothetical protein
MFYWKATSVAVSHSVIEVTHVSLPGKVVYFQSMCPNRHTKCLISQHGCEIQQLFVHINLRAVAGYTRMSFNIFDRHPLLAHREVI